MSDRKPSRKNSHKKSKSKFRKNSAKKSSSSSPSPKVKSRKTSNPKSPGRTKRNSKSGNYKSPSTKSRRNSKSGNSKSGSRRRKSSNKKKSRRSVSKNKDKDATKEHPKRDSNLSEEDLTAGVENLNLPTKTEDDNPFPFKARALFDYEKVEDTEVSLKQGDEFWVEAVKDTGWGLVRFGDEVGWVSLDYIEMIQGGKTTTTTTTTTTNTANTTVKAVRSPIMQHLSPQMAGRSMKPRGSASPNVEETKRINTNVMPFSSPKIQKKTFKRQHCPDCNQDFSDLAKFCDECGKQLQSVDGPVVQLYRTPEPSPMGDMAIQPFQLESPVNPSPSAALVFHYLDDKNSSLLNLEKKNISGTIGPKRGSETGRLSESSRARQTNIVSVTSEGKMDIKRPLGLKGNKHLKGHRFRFFKWMNKEPKSLEGAPPSPQVPSREAPQSPIGPKGALSVRSELRKLQRELDNQNAMIGLTPDCTSDVE